MLWSNSTTRFSQNLGRVDGLLAAPYGYNVPIWAAGVAAMSRYGSPAVGQIVAFVAGSVGAFLLLGYAGRKHIDQQVPGHAPSIVAAI